jgi:hypothetical protein
VSKRTADELVVRLHDLSIKRLLSASARYPREHENRLSPTFRLHKLQLRSHA